VGYRRYDTEEELKVLNAIYAPLRLYTNFFQPVMKLINKERVGSKVKKTYDRARTPFQRVSESPFVSQQKKNALKEQYETLNPVQLKREIIKLQDRLDSLARSKNNQKREERHINLEYILR